MTPGSFASGPVNAPTAAVALDVKSHTFMIADYTGAQADSFGGVVFGYTTPIDLTSFQNTGIVFQLDSPSMTGASLEIKDNTGKVWKALIGDLKSFGQKYKIDLAQMEGIDKTQVSEVVLVLTGQGAKKLNIDWGSFNFSSQVPVITGNSFDETTLAVLNADPALSAGAGNSVNGEPVGRSEVHQLAADEFSFIFDVSKSPSSFSFANITKGFFDQNGIFVGTPLNLPENFIMAARGRENGQVKVEITDTGHQIASFILRLRPIYQNYTLSLAVGGNVPFDFDHTNIASIVFVEDQTIAGSSPNDLVKIKIKGLDFGPVIPPGLPIIGTLVNEGMSYFQSAAGLDPATHLPYDSLPADGIPTEDVKFTQPTLIGFYLQILGDVVKGKIQNGMTPAEALTELNTVLDSLLSVQQNFGWNGLIPWMDLDPVLDPAPWIGLGDNANLTQSIAVMIGALEGSSLNGTDDIVAKAELFLDNQEPGYTAFVDPQNGLFFGAFNTTTGQFENYHMDRLTSEFRGAIAFLKVRYPNIPQSVWDGLLPVFRDYTTANGETITNLSSFEGGAFQYFWPLLRNNELDFIGFRNLLYNYLVTQSDYASLLLIPGFVSASQRVDDGYFGRIGIPQVAETPTSLLVDMGSTYALASAYGIDPTSVLAWLNAIRDQLPSLVGDKGFFDAARSGTEVARRFLGIDIASTILGLSGSGPDDFATYLKNRGIELNYNLLYDQVSRDIHSPATLVPISAPPQTLATRSLAVFSHFTSEGVINNLETNTTDFTGIHINYDGIMPDGFGGHFWNLDQDYDGRVNRLIFFYSVTDSPDKLNLEFKDAADNSLLKLVIDLVDTPGFHITIVDLPNLSSLQAIQKVILVIDQNMTQDIKGDFFIHAISIQDPPGMTADPIVGTSDLTLNVPFVHEAVSHISFLDTSNVSSSLLAGSFVVVPRPGNNSFKENPFTPLGWNTSVINKYNSIGDSSYLGKFSNPRPSLLGIYANEQNAYQKQLETRNGFFYDPFPRHKKKIRLKKRTKLKQFQIAPKNVMELLSQESKIPLQPGSTETIQPVPLTPAASNN